MNLNFKVSGYNLISILDTMPTSIFHTSFSVASGDQDSVIPLMGSRLLVHRLATELGLKTSVPYGAWFQGKQVTLYLSLFRIP